MKLAAAVCFTVGVSVPIRIVLFGYFASDEACVSAGILAAGSAILVVIGSNISDAAKKGQP